MSHRDIHEREGDGGAQADRPRRAQAAQEGVQEEAQASEDDGARRRINANQPPIP